MIDIVLVDTSVWIDHLRDGNDQLITLLNDGDAFCHPLIVGEIACGYLENRLEVLDSLQQLPQAIQVDHEEVLLFIEKNQIMGQGLGYIDISILASSLLSGLSLWTFDKKLNKVAKMFKINYSD